MSEKPKDLSLEFSDIEAELLEGLGTSDNFNHYSEKKSFKGEEYLIYYKGKLVLEVELIYFAEDYRKIRTEFTNVAKQSIEIHTTETPPELEKLLKYIKNELKKWDQ